MELRKKGRQNGKIVKYDGFTGEQLLPCGTAGCPVRWGQAGAVLSPSPRGLGWHRAVGGRGTGCGTGLAAEGVTGPAGASIHLCLMETRGQVVVREGE